MSTAQESGYFELLKAEIELFRTLADIRMKRNDFHDAKMRAWDDGRYKLASNQKFEEFWRQAEPSRLDEHLHKMELDVISELRKIQTSLDHLKFAGLGDPRDRA